MRITAIRQTFDVKDINRMLNHHKQDSGLKRHIESQYLQFNTAYNKDNGLFPISFVSAQFGITPRRIYQLIKSNKLCSYNFFGSTFISGKSILSYFSS